MPVDAVLLSALRSVPRWLDQVSFTLRTCSAVLRRVQTTVRAEDVARLDDIEQELLAIKHRVTAALQHLR